MRKGALWNFTVNGVEEASPPLCLTYASTDTPVSFQGFLGQGGNKGADVSFMTLPASTAVYPRRIKVTSLKVCINMTVNT